LCTVRQLLDMAGPLEDGPFLNSDLLAMCVCTFRAATCTIHVLTTMRYRGNPWRLIFLQHVG
jgi:hypothetical protein